MAPTNRTAVPGRVPGSDHDTPSRAPGVLSTLNCRTLREGLRGSLPGCVLPPCPSVSRAPEAGHENHESSHPRQLTGTGLLFRTASHKTQGSHSPFPGKSLVPEQSTPGGGEATARGQEESAARPCWSPSARDTGPHPSALSFFPRPPHRIYLLLLSTGLPQWPGCTWGAALLLESSSSSQLSAVISTGPTPSSITPAPATQERDICPPSSRMPWVSTGCSRGLKFQGLLRE